MNSVAAACLETNILAQLHFLAKKPLEPGRLVSLVRVDPSSSEPESYSAAMVPISGSTAINKQSDPLFFIGLGPSNQEEYFVPEARIGAFWNLIEGWMQASPALPFQQARTTSSLAVERQRLNEDAICEFGLVPQVDAIYTDRFRSEDVFTVFVSGDTYDDRVMDMLIDCELALMKRFPSRRIAFHYLPQVDPGAHQMVRSAARLIFLRHA